MINSRLGPILSAVVVSLSALGCSLDVRQSTPASQRRQVHLSDCRFASYATNALCGKLEVFEDPKSQAGRRIFLQIVILPAIEARPARDPVFFLAGGPGQGAATIASAGEDSLMSQLRRRRDLVFIDQRGTGDSHPLNCNLSSDPALLQTYFDELFPIERVRACRVALERHSDLKLYTTPAAVADLEQARAALGYDTINLYGISYGTMVALEYIRQYPHHVRAAALAGVTTPAAKLPLHYAKGAQEALNSLIHACALEDGCRAAYPSLEADLAKALASLERDPATLTLAHPKTKTLQTARLTPSAFTERLRNLLYNTATASLLPLLIHRAAQGDWTAFGKVATRTTAAHHHTLAMGLYLTVTCSESVPLISEDEISRETSGTFLGEYRTRRHQAACREWPRGDVPASYYAPVYSSVPIMMLSGELDGATPARLGSEASQSLSNSRQVLLPGTAHDYSSGCAKALVAEFLSTAATTGLNTSCAASLKRPPFARELPARFAH